jgi:hypothetical protein
MLGHPDGFEAERFGDARKFRRMSILAGEGSEQTDFHFIFSWSLYPSNKFFPE